MPDSTITPPRITRMRSASRPTTARSWLISSTPVPRDRISAMSARMRACTVASSAVVGSSAMSSGGSRAIAAAMSARCRSPPESSPERRRAANSGSGMPTEARSSCTRARRSGWDIRSWMRSGSSISRPTGRSGSSETSASCRMRPTSRPRMRRHSRSPASPSSRPPMRSVLDSAREPRPAMPSSARAVTDLPDPDSPTIATHSPRAIVNDTPCTTSVSPNATRRSVTSRSGAASGSVMRRPFRDVRALGRAPSSRSSFRRS